MVELMVFYARTQVKSLFTADAIGKSILQSIQLHTLNTVLPLQDDVDMDVEDSTVQQNEPYVMRLSSDTGFQYVLLVERKPLFDDDGCRDSYIALFSCYFSFNISYPRFLSCALLFIQHYIHVPTTEKIPQSVTQLYYNLVKIDVD